MKHLHSLLVSALVLAASAAFADGSDIVFDRDYHGAHRGVNTLPGPFAEGGAEIRVG